MEVIVRRPGREFEKELKATYPDCVYSWSMQTITFEVPDLEGYSDYCPYRKLYYNSWSEDNSKGWTDDESGQWVSVRATAGRTVRQYSDGSVEYGEWKKIP